MRGARYSLCFHEVLRSVDQNQLPAGSRRPAGPGGPRLTAEHGDGHHYRLLAAVRPPQTPPTLCGPATDELEEVQAAVSHPEEQEATDRLHFSEDDEGYPNAAPL